MTRQVPCMGLYKFLQATLISQVIQRAVKSWHFITGSYLSLWLTSWPPYHLLLCCRVPLPNLVRSARPPWSPDQGGRVKLPPIPGPRGMLCPSMLLSIAKPADHVSTNRSRASPPHDVTRGRTNRSPDTCCRSSTCIGRGSWLSRLPCSRAEGLQGPRYLCVA